MSSSSSQQFESYLPVYDSIPDKWEEAQSFIVENLKKISNAVNIRTIGWLLDEELLSGQAFIPGVTIPGNNPGIFQQVLRKVVIFGPISPGLNTRAHGINFDNKFTLIDLWATGTNSTALVATNFSNSDTISLDGTNVYITSNGIYDRCFAFLEYCQEA